MRGIASVATGVGLALLVGSNASAQDVGTFRWQLQPFCNVVTMHVTRVEGVFRLEGSDDQCGAATVAPVIGIAAINPSGSIALGLTHVTTPGGVPVHVDALVTLPDVSGTWRDSEGHEGSFVFTPGAGIGGSPRPAAQGVHHDHEQGAAGSVSVGPQANPGGTGIQSTAVGAGALQAATTGSQNSGLGATALQFTTTGVGNVGIGASALRLNSTGSFSTAVGYAALHSAKVSGLTAMGATALFANTTGCCNAAFGYEALSANVTGSENTAVGYQALRSSTGLFNTALGAAAAQATTGTANTAVGAQALYENTTGNNNSAFGDSAIRAVVAGHANAAFGHHAGFALTSGSGNVFVGSQAGKDLATGGFNTFIGWQAAGGFTSGSDNILIGRSLGSNPSLGDNNIYLGSFSSNATESNTIRLGTNQTSAFIAGVAGQASAGVAVHVNAAGKLGIMASSRRFKENIVPLSSARRVVQALEPVQFTYKLDHDDGTRQLQYGLIAEDVQGVDPNLVVTVDGQVQTVRYHFLAPLLVAEVQRLENELQTLRGEIAALRAIVATSSAAR